MTGTEAITEALEDLGILEIGGTADSAHSAKGFRRLCQILGTWHTEGIEVPIVTWISFAISAGQVTYTIGEDGTPDKDTTRPESVRGAFIRDSAGIDHPMRKLSEQEYMLTRDKGDSDALELEPAAGSGGRPTTFWYRNTVPNGTLHLGGIPEISETIHLFCSGPMAEPAAVGSDVIIPRGYDLPLVSNLVVELAPSFGLEATQTQARNAYNHRKAVRELCARDRMTPPRLYVTGAGGTFTLSEGTASGEALLLE